MFLFISRFFLYNEFFLTTGPQVMPIKKNILNTYIYIYRYEILSSKVGCSSLSQFWDLVETIFFFNSQNENKRRKLLYIFRMFITIILTKTVKQSVKQINILICLNLSVRMKWNPLNTFSIKISVIHKRFVAWSRILFARRYKFSKKKKKSYLSYLKCFTVNRIFCLFYIA